MKIVQKLGSDFRVKFFLNDFHSFMEQFHLINRLLPPHWIDFADSLPKSSCQAGLFFIDFADSIIIGVNKYYQIFVDGLSNVIDDLLRFDRLEGKFLFLEDFFDCIGDDFWEMEVDQTC